MDEAIAARRFPCPNCGGELRWDPAHQSLACAACGTPQPLDPAPVEQATFIEHGLADSLQRARNGQPAPGRVAVQCGSCQAVSYFDRGTAADRCPFCGSTAIVPYAALGDRFRPESVVPFLVPEADARARAVQWIRSAWMAPRKLARLARTDVVKGVYLPFWTFDAHAVGHWEGPGNRGIIEMDFDDLLVCADRAADAALLPALEPWPAKALRPYDPRFVAGWTVVRDQLGLDEATMQAHARMDRELLAAARHNQPAKQRDKMRLLGAEYARETCKQTLLPIWLLDYTYLGRPYRIAINGASGNAAGKAPTSLLKVALVVVAALWLYIFFQDPGTALEIPVWIVKGLWWLIARPFSGG